MPKLTKRIIDALQPDPAKDVFTWDSELRGFGVRMKPSSAATYLVQYRTPQGRTRRLAFAKIGSITPDQARDKARKLLADAQAGRDPSAERHEAREALTVAELCERYLEAARAGNVTTRFHKPKRASTLAIDEGRISRHIVPRIGHQVAGKLTRADVQRLADDIAAGKTTATVKTKAHGLARVTGGPGAAARVVELLGGVWTWAERRGLVAGQNPVRGIEKRKGDPKERVLTAGELARLGATLRERAEQHPAATAAIRLIVLTGLRREEAVRLRWREIDFASGCLRLEQTKTGRSMRPIGKPALELLAALPRSGGFVFPNRDGSGSADLKKTIAAIFDAAGLPDARAQTLRRTFATVGDEIGYGDATVGELLGHAKRGVTQRSYIRRPDEALIAAADRVSERIARAMDESEGDVLPFTKSGGNTAA